MYHQSTICYILHVILGSLFYPGYDFLSQAVSDLTSDASPSRYVARTFSAFYALFAVLGVFMIFKYLIKGEHVLFKAGILIYLFMQIISGIGYALFPLKEGLTANSTGNMMHMVTTICVVLLSVAALLLIVIGAFKSNHVKMSFVTIAALSLLATGAILTSNIAESFFGLAERVSIYTVVLYTLILGFQRLNSVSNSNLN